MTSLYFFSSLLLKTKSSRKSWQSSCWENKPKGCLPTAGGTPAQLLPPHSPNIQEQLGKIWGMLSLRALQMGESCLRKGQDGCLGTATALVWPSTATRFCRTCPYMASGSKGPMKQEPMEDRYFIEKTNQAFTVLKLFKLLVGLRNCTNPYPVVNGA